MYRQNFLVKNNHLRLTELSFLAQVFKPKTRNWENVSDHLQKAHHHWEAIQLGNAMNFSALKMCLGLLWLTFLLSIFALTRTVIINININISLYY